jgi:hypothetical protein
MRAFFFLGIPLLAVGFLQFTTFTPADGGGKKPVAADWDELFNDKKMTAWEGLSQHWAFAQEGLVGSNLPNGLRFRTFLCSKKEYKDFEIRFQVRVRGPAKANSGLNFRSKVLDRDRFTVSGPQADIGEQYWGALSSEFIPGKPSTALRLAPAAVLAKVKQQDFNEYYVKCVGKHVTIKLNGEVTVDEDLPWMAEGGIIAWQIHANPTEVTFRNVRIRDLSSGPGRLPTVIPEEEKKKGP